MCKSIDTSHDCVTIQGGETLGLEARRLDDGRILRSWQMDVDGCSNLELFLHGMYSQIHDNFAKELSKLKALSFKLTIKLQLQTDDDMIDLSLCHRRMIVIDLPDIKGLYTKFPSTPIQSFEMGV